MTRPSLPTFIVASLLIVALISCSPKSKIGQYGELNSRAASEYLQPIRPGYEGRNPWWNVFAKKFIYAPAFDFQKVPKAYKYKFTVTDNNGGQWSFTADSPSSALSPIWDSIPVGDVCLTVTALRKDGSVKDTVGTRKFFRDYPFKGPYPGPASSYRQAAIKAAYYIHNMPAVQHWIDNVEPDMEYNLNTYATKIIGATILNECVVWKEIPSKRDDALKIARNAAEFLLAQSRPEGESMAFFPPTYYLDLVFSGREENKDKAMTMEGCRAVQVFLSLYDVTSDMRYLNHAKGIMETFRRLQREDGSIPIKVDFLTGEPVNGVGAMLGPFVSVIQRLEKDYGIRDYEDMREKGEEWMRKVAVSTFDLTGQFEDVSVLGLKPYENLTNCTAAPYAQYLLDKDVVSKEDLSDAIDLIRLSEDQFVHWDYIPDGDGIKRFCTPCVFEQYKYEMAIDNSTCNVANAYLSLYEETLDPLALAKGRALIDNLTIVQDPVSGRIPTVLEFRGKQKEHNTFFWINCCVASIQTLLRMDRLDHDLNQ